MSLLTGICFLAYYLLICIYVRRWNATFSRFWLVSGIALSCWYKWKSCFPVFICRMGTGIWIFFWLCVAALWIRMKIFEKQRSPEDLEYLIVLGARVDHKRITCSLRMRLDRAYKYAVHQKQVRIVVSGGQGKGEDVSEAQAMADYLIERGIAPERIFLEDHSASTGENLRFTAKVIPDILFRKTGLITNSFHIYRACLIGKREGYRNLFPVTAESEKILFVNYMIREVFAILVIIVQSWKNSH